MLIYARPFLAFLAGMMRSDPTSDAYLFHTRLTRISDALRDEDPLRALNRVTLLAEGMGGGSRIGTALAQFAARDARRFVNGRSVVVILSDGYDSDAPDVIENALVRLRKRGVPGDLAEPPERLEGLCPRGAGHGGGLAPCRSLCGGQYPGRSRSLGTGVVPPMTLTLQEKIKLDRHIARLQAEGRAFALATVVRTVDATSAKPGGKALILDDGTIVEGWIGGGCARGAVSRAAMAALAEGQPKFVSLRPEELLSAEGLVPGDERDGVRFARNGCPSKGSMDIFVEPVLPQPRLTVLGAGACRLGTGRSEWAVRLLPHPCRPRFD